MTNFTDTGSWELAIRWQVWNVGRTWELDAGHFNRHFYLVHAADLDPDATVLMASFRDGDRPRCVAMVTEYKAGTVARHNYGQGQCYIAACSPGPGAVT